MLVGFGRWGSSDPWLGIPVRFSQISCAKIIVEASLPNLNVDPSQGSHFFQNMTSLRLGYFTLPLYDTEAFLDWKWLESLPVVAQTGFVSHVRLEKPIEIQMDGRSGRGIILKTVEEI